MDWLTVIGLALRYAPTVKDIVDEAISNEDIVTKIKKVSTPLAELLDKAGGQLFPKVAPALRIVAGVVVAFDPSATKWLQGSLNAVLDPSPNLVVDGIYGPKTTRAVEALQAKLGLVVDGVAGELTKAAIQTLLQKVG